VILFDLTCNYNSIMININKLGTCRNIQDKCDLRGGHSVQLSYQTSWTDLDLLVSWF